MVLSPQVFFIALGVSEVGLALFKRSTASARRADRGSLALLWGGIGAAIFAAIYVSFALPRFAVPYSPVGYGLAIVVFLAGLALRWWSIVHLGRFFTVDVAIAQDHRIVDDGPYRLLRHPSYTGALLAFVGLGLMLCNWLAALVLVVPVLLLFLRRITIEEQALERAFGEAYHAYRSRTKRLVPFVY